MSKTTAIALNNLQLPDDDWLLLIPSDATINGRDGREYINPGPVPTVEAFYDNAADIPIDIEHSTHLQAPHGKPAPAVGWIVDIEGRGNETWGKVQWTDQGRQLVADRQYRYYSPAYLHDDGRILAIASLGLTNKPNLRQLPALNNQGNDQGGTMGNEFQVQVRTALGLNAEATEAEVLAKIAEYQGSVALNRQHDLVPKADYQLALNRATAAEGKLAELQRAEFESRRDAAIDKAVMDGKIAPASKDYYRVSCNSEDTLRAFEDFTASAPKVITTEDMAPDGKPGSTVALNAEQKQMAAMFGRSGQEAEEMYKEEVEA